MKVTQSILVTAILNPNEAVPAGLGSRAGDTSRRFAVYRNNVVASLAAALGTAFPVLRKLLGAEFFDSMAAEYARLHPPDSPLMMFYGQNMPSFLDSFPPVRTLPYLADIARLELAIRQSYHAADSSHVSLEAVMQLSADEIAQSRLRISPAFQILRSSYPAFSIWMANARNGPAPRPDAEDLCVVRPGFDPEPRLLHKGEFEFVSGLIAGISLTEAYELALTANDCFKLDASIGWLVASNSISGIVKC